MEKRTILELIKSRLASIGWKLFIWGNDFAEDEYFERVYQQEVRYKAEQSSEKSF